MDYHRDMTFFIFRLSFPAGLPLAVTISLAYSTKKMYSDKCFVRVLSACETMGNVTNICSDKTGTLTENRMMVVEGWFGDVSYDQDAFGDAKVSDAPKRIISENLAMNRTAYVIWADREGTLLERPTIVGNRTEGALMLMAKVWGCDSELIKSTLFDPSTCKIYSFNSTAKRSSAIIVRPDGSVRLYCKGASELVLLDCISYSDATGNEFSMSKTKTNELVEIIDSMADNALRTL